MTIKDFFSFRANRLFWVNIILMIVVFCALLFGVLKGLDVYTLHGESVVVPSIKGMGEDEAKLMLRNKGLEYAVVDSNYVKNAPAGSILEQNPGPGQHVKSGRTIYLTINSLSIPTRTVPDVADNSSLRQAQAKLLGAGFKLDTEQYVSGEKDWVYGVKYKGRELSQGEKIPTGAILTLLVGNGSHDPELESDSTRLDDVPETSNEVAEDESWF